MNRKQPDNTERTKQNIKEAFWRLYKEKRIENITVKEISDRAGYNRSTFYAYFTDVHNVLEQIERDLMPGPESIPEMQIGKENPVDILEEFLKIYEVKGEYYSLLLSENGDPAFATKMKNIFKAMVVEKLGIYKLLPEEELDYVLEFQASATISVIRHWYDMGKNIPAEKLFMMMYKLMDNRMSREIRSIQKDSIL